VASKTISKCGEYVAIFDDDLAAHMDWFGWSLHHCGKGRLYVRCEWLQGVKSRIYMHHLVADLKLKPRPSSSHVLDHINGNGLDNRAANLRWLLKCDNAFARQQQRDNPAHA